jgi:hypothetical protein
MDKEKHTWGDINEYCYAILKKVQPIISRVTTLTTITGCFLSVHKSCPGNHGHLSH